MSTSMNPSLTQGRRTTHILLQYFAVGGLRVAEVHELVEQLVDDDEVVSDALLLQLLEVLTEYLQHNV